MITEVVLVEKPFTQPEMKRHHAGHVGIFAESRSANVVQTKSFIDSKTGEMAVALARTQFEVSSEKISDGLVGPNQ